MNQIDEEITSLDDVVRKMAGQVEANLKYSSSVYLNYNPKVFYPEVDDAKVNAFEREVEARCLRTLLKERLFASDMRKVTGLLYMVQDLERLGDHAQDLLEFSLKLKDGTGKDNFGVVNLMGFVIKMVNDSVSSYIARDASSAKEVIDRDDYVDKEYLDIIGKLIKADKEKTISSEFAIYTTLVVKYLERIADHATNVAEWVIYILTGFYKDAQIV